jgi:hypothetical protein
VVVVTEADPLTETAPDWAFVPLVTH